MIKCAILILFFGNLSMKKFIILAFALISFGAASTIKSITFNGFVHISNNAALDMTRLRVGDEMNDEVSNRVIKTLYSQGYFKDIYIEDNNGDIIIHAKEKPVIARIDIEGVVTNDKKSITTILGIKKGQMYDERASATAKERVRQFYEVKGFFDTIVDEVVTPINTENSVHVVYKVNRCENITIKKVNLVGAKVKSYSDIEPAVENKEREALGWMWGRNGGEVKIFELPNDSEKIREEYFKSGYLDAKVSKAYLNTNFEGYSAELSYYINEGEQYKAGEISIDAPEFLELDSEKIIKSDLKLEQGDTFNTDWLKRDQKIITDMVADKGYAYARVVPLTAQNPENHTVDVKYQILPNEEVYIRNVIISGNDKTLDRIIRRELYLTEGNRYNRADLEDSKNALKRKGYFEDVEIKEHPVSDNQMDLEVAVKETMTGTITGGIGYGSGDGLLLSAGISENNIFGSGYQGSVNIEKNKRGLNGSIGLTNPRIYDSEYSLGGTVFANDWEWSNYREKNHGFNITAGRQIGRYTNAYISYQLQKTNISGLNPFYAEAGYLNGKKTKSSVVPRVIWDNTDDHYLPRSGFVASTGFEIAGLGGDTKFVRNDTGFSIYKGLADDIGWDLILRYKANFSYLWNNDESKLPINEKLFLGGMQSIRGYDHRSVSPRKTICNPMDEYGRTYLGCRDIETGGKVAFQNSVEISWPLINRIKLRGMAFYDFGMIGQKRFTEEKRSSVGVGIEWMTFIGPLQVVFVKPIGKKDGDQTSSFEFNIGQRF